MSEGSRKYPSFTLYWRLILQARPYWPHVAAYLLLSLLATPLALLAPLPLKLAVDCIIGSRPLPRWVQTMLPGGGAASDRAALLFVAGMVLAVAALTLVHHLTAAMLKTYVGEQLVTDFRSRLFRHVQRLSLAYHDRQGTSDSN
jgi:ATP-binding cassette subfamily B protein